MWHLFSSVTFPILLPVTLVQYVSGGRRPDGPGLIGELLEAEYAMCSSVAVIAGIFVHFPVLPMSQGQALSALFVGEGGGLFQDGERIDLHLPCLHVLCILEKIHHQLIKM